MVIRVYLREQGQAIRIAYGQKNRSDKHFSTMSFKIPKYDIMITWQSSLVLTCAKLASIGTNVLLDINPNVIFKISRCIAYKYLRRRSKNLNLLSFLVLIPRIELLWNNQAVIERGVWARVPGTYCVNENCNFFPFKSFARRNFDQETQIYLAKIADASHMCYNDLQKYLRRNTIRNLLHPII